MNRTLNIKCTFSWACLPTSRPFQETCSPMSERKCALRMRYMSCIPEVIRYDHNAPAKSVLPFPEIMWYKCEILQMEVTVSDMY